jgi:hypothetical protein
MSLKPISVNRRRTKLRGSSVNITVSPQQERHLGFAEPGGGLADGVQHKLEVEGGLADDLQHL